MLDSLGTPNEQLVTIQDHHTVPVLTIVNNVTITEDDGKAVLTVSLSAATGRFVSINFASSDIAGTQACNVFNGRASARCDYIPVSGTLIFPARTTSQTITVLIVQDSYAEGNETFHVTLSNLIGA